MDSPTPTLNIVFSQVFTVCLSVCDGMMKIFFKKSTREKEKAKEKQTDLIDKILK